MAAREGWSALSLVWGILHLSEIRINCMNEYYICRGIIFQILDDILLIWSRFSPKDPSNISQESTAFCSIHGFTELFNLLYCIMGISDVEILFH